MRDDSTQVVVVGFGRDPKPNPVALRAVRLTFGSVIGTQPDSGSAGRALRQGMARLHPDKTGHLHLTEPQQLGAQDCLDTLGALRDIMRHEECAQMPYQPGRLAYGQMSWREMAASAAVAGACYRFLLLYCFKATTAIILVGFSVITWLRTLQRPE